MRREIPHTITALPARGLPLFDYFRARQTCIAQTGSATRWPRPIGTATARAVEAAARHCGVLEPTGAEGRDNSAGGIPPRAQSTSQTIGYSHNRSTLSPHRLDDAKYGLNPAHAFQRESYLPTCQSAAKQAWRVPPRCFTSLTVAATLLVHLADFTQVACNISRAPRGRPIEVTNSTR